MVEGSAENYSSVSGMVDGYFAGGVREQDVVSSYVAVPNQGRGKGII